MYNKNSNFIFLAFSCHVNIWVYFSHISLNKKHKNTIQMIYDYNNYNNIKTYNNNINNNIINNTVIKQNGTIILFLIKWTLRGLTIFKINYQFKMIWNEFPIKFQFSLVLVLIYISSN